MKRWFGVGGEPFGILDQCKIMTSIPGVADSSAKEMTLDCHFLAPVPNEVLPVLRIASTRLY